MSAPTTVRTLAEVQSERVALLPHVEVSSGVVAFGEFAGARVTPDGLWTCVTTYEQSTAGLVGAGLRACFQSTAGWVHNPICSHRDAEPVRPLPKMSSRDEAEVNAYEWNLGPHRPAWEIDEAARKAAAKRAGEVQS